MVFFAFTAHEAISDSPQFIIHRFFSVQIEKGQTRLREFSPLNFNPGGDLRSRAVTRAVSSALQGLTSVFGMGTGVTLAVRPPGNLRRVTAGVKYPGINFATEGSRRTANST